MTAVRLIVFFGMQMPDRCYDGGYDQVFNGMEKQDGIYDNGNSYDFGARILDPRLGRWFSRDPLATSYPGLSPYISVNNNPVLYVDLGGLDWFVNYQGFFLWSDKEETKGWYYAGTKLPGKVGRYKILAKIKGRLYHKTLPMSLQ